MQTLRAYQARALADLRQSVAGGQRRTLLVAPTGSGKTTIASALIHGARAKGSRVLFIAHRQELIDQCVARLAEHGVPAGVIMAGRSAVAHPVQVASIQTLVRRKFPPADLVVIDEAHHARAASYQRVVETYPSAPIIGLTATPWRTDGRGLGALFDGLVVAARPRELVDAGFLCPVTGFVYDNPDLSAVRTTGGDFDDGGAAEAMGYIGGSIVRRWLHFRPGRTVVFGCTIEHSRQLAAAFIEAGVAAEHLDGETPRDVRADILGRLAAGFTEVVCNVGVLTEGWDLPALQCVVLARPTKSVGLYLQMAGRGLRPADGKTVARIHDHAGNALRHGLVDADREYSLEGDTRRGGPMAPPTTSCPKCFAIHAPAPSCPVCGHVYVAKAGRKLNQVAGVELEFSEIRSGATAARRTKRITDAEGRAAMAELVQLGKRFAYKPGWAAFRFHERFGFYPKREWRACG